MPAEVRAGKAEQSAVENTINVQHNQRRPPMQIGAGAKTRRAMARRLHSKEVPGVHEAPMVVVLGFTAVRRIEELLLGLAHRPKAGEQFVHKKALFNDCVPATRQHIVLSSYFRPPA